MTKGGKVVGYQAVVKIGKKPFYGPMVQDPSLARSALLKKLQSGTPAEGEPFSTSARGLLDGRLKKEWSEATLDLGRAVLERVDGSVLGEMFFHNVCPEDIVRWRNSIELSASSCHRYQRIVERWLNLLGNPVKAPKPTVREPDVRILTRAEQRRLYGACRTERARFAVLMMFEWGLRPGELCGLKHEDRFETGVRVQRSISKRGVPKNTKTDRSKALLPIIDPELKKWIGSKKGYLLGTRHNTPMVPDDLLEMVKAIALDAKLGDMTTMDLRHTAAVNMLSAGVDPATVASITRHSVDTLLKVYYRSTDHGKVEALKKSRAWRQVDKTPKGGKKEATGR